MKIFLIHKEVQDDAEPVTIVWHGSSKDRLEIYEVSPYFPKPVLLDMHHLAFAEHLIPAVKVAINEVIFKDQSIG